MSLALPAATELAPYFVKYVDAASRAAAMLESGTVEELLSKQPVDLHHLLDGVDDEFARRAYAPGKWTLAESLVHVADTERVFAYRLLRIARGDTTPLAGFEQDDWVPLSGANTRRLGEIFMEAQGLGWYRASSNGEALSRNDTSRIVILPETTNGCH